MLKKIAIHIDKDFTNELWRLLFNLYDFCHGEKVFRNEDFATLSAASLAIRYHKDVRTIDAIVPYGDLLDYSTLSKELNNNTVFFISVVYIKKDASLDNPNFMPLLSWLTNSQSTCIKNDFSFGVDISGLTKEDKRKYIYTNGQRISTIDFLPTPRAGKNCIYYIDINNDGKTTRKFPYSLSHNAPGSSKSISLPIDEDSLIAYFSPKKEIINNPSQKLLIDSIRKLNMQVDGTTNLMEEWLVKAYMDSFGIKNKSFPQNYIAIKDNLHEYCNNIYELVQNIIFHTEEKTGLLSMRFYKKKDVRVDLHGKIPQFEKYSDDDRFLVFDLIDYGKKGIVNTFNEENKETILNDNDKSAINETQLRLDHFFNPKEILPDENIQLTLRYVAHLGIKTFVSSVINNGGYFFIETNKNEKQKERLESNNGTITDSIEVDGDYGTIYQVVLPVKERISPISAPIRIIDADCDKENDKKNNHDSTLLNSLLFDAEKIQVSPVENATIYNKDDQEIFVLKYGEQLIDKIKTVFTSNVCIDASSFNVFSPNFIFKLIAYVRLNLQDQLQPETIVLYNLDDNVFNRLEEISINLTEIISRKRQEVWSDKYATVLISHKLQILSLCGTTKDYFCYINHELRKLYSNALKKISLEFSPLLCKRPKELNRFILHYGLETAFTSHVENEVLAHSIEDTETNNTGSVVKIPARLGDKIYIDEFFQADHIFLNGFYATKYALCIARHIIKQFNRHNEKKRVILLGYHQYSRLLIDCVSKSLIEYTKFTPQSNYYIDKLVFGNEDKESNELNFDTVNISSSIMNSSKDSITEKKQLVNSNEKCILITIVPIATTLTTFDKLISCFKKEMPSYHIDYECNYCTILIRDNATDNELLNKNGQTRLESEWGWTEVNEFNRTVSVGTRMIHYLCSKKTKWHRLIDCNTFPSDFSQEEFIVKTRNSSLNVYNLLGYPQMSIPPDKSNNNQLTDYYKFTGNRLKDMKDFIHYGHLVHEGKHYRYFFDIPSYINESEKKIQLRNHSRESYEGKWPPLYKWVVDYLKETNETNNDDKYHEAGGRLRDKEARINVIVTSEPDKNPQLTSFINKYLFDDSAYVLFLDIHDRDIKYKHSIIKQLELTRPSESNTSDIIREESGNNISDNRLINYYYIDQALLTGNAYYTAKRQMSEILNNPAFKFNGVITIINRLSRYKYKEISNDIIIKDGIYSFNHIFIPPCKLENTDCYLCTLRDIYENLKNNSVITDCRNIIESNKSKYKEKRYNRDEKNEVENKERVFLRMQWQNRVFYEISNANLDNDHVTINDKSIRINQILNDLFDESTQTIDDRISFLKAISSPPLSEYARIRQYAFRKMLDELKQVLKKETPQIRDLILLKVLLKHLAMLGSNALVRKDVIVGSWELYRTVQKQIPTEIQYVRLNIQEIKKQQKIQFDNKLLLLEKWADDITDYVSNRKNKKEVSEYIKGVRNELSQLDKKDCKLDKFPKQLLFYIKMAIHNDPSKSLWLGELLRTGNEMNVELYNSNFSVSKTKMFNDLFNKKSPLEDDKILLQYLFYENTTIIRKTLDNFEKEKLSINEKRIGLKEIFEDKCFSTQDIKKKIWNQKNELIAQYKKIVIEKYYYNWLRKFYNAYDQCISINQDNSIDGIRFIEKYTLILYARLLLRRFSDSNVKNDSFDKNTNHLLEVLAEIMDAQAAYILIKQHGNDEQRNESSVKFAIIPDKIGNKEIVYNDSFYSMTLFNNSDKSNSGHSFVMRDISQDISQSIPRGESFYGKYSRATYLILNIERESNNPRSDNRDDYNNIIIATFLYATEKQENVRYIEFMKEQQELGRLLLLLKPELDSYANHVWKEKMYDLWEGKNKTERLLNKVNLKSGHRFKIGEDYFNKIDGNDAKRIYNEFYTMTNMVVSFIFTSLINHSTAKVYHEKSNNYSTAKLNFTKKPYNISQIFDNKFIAILKELNYHEWRNIWDEIISIKYDMRICVNLFVFQSFIIQCFSNAHKHCKPSRNILSVIFEQDRMIIRNEINETIPTDNIRSFNNKYNIETITNRINSYEVEDYGLTLISFIMYCESVGMKCVPKYKTENNKQYFNVNILYYEDFL